MIGTSLLTSFRSCDSCLREEQRKVQLAGDGQGSRKDPGEALNRRGVALDAAHGMDVAPTVDQKCEVRRGRSDTDVTRAINMRDVENLWTDRHEPGPRDIVCQAEEVAFAGATFH